MTPEALAERLIGTCENVDPLDELAESDLEVFDALCFCCAICDWWCSMDEGNDYNQGFICDECFNDTD